MTGKEILHWGDVLGQQARWNYGFFGNKNSENKFSTFLLGSRVEARKHCTDTLLNTAVKFIFKSTI